MSSTLIGTIYEYDENRATVDDVINAVNSASVTMTSIGDDALWLNLAFSFGLRLTSLVKPTVAFYDAFANSADSANDIHIASGAEDFRANVFAHDGHEHLVISYINVKGEEDTMVLGATAYEE